MLSSDESERPFGLPMPARPGQQRALNRLLAVIGNRVAVRDGVATDSTNAADETAGIDAVRLQYHAATGAGKTLVSRLLAESIAARVMAFGAPRIDLLGQAFEDYRRVAARPIDAIVVCSTPEIREARGFPAGTIVTTHTGALGQRLDTPVPDGMLRVVFFTYQSSRKLARALAGHTTRLDLLVLDEAHRVASPESAFRFVWDAGALPAAVRLALTATPTPEMAAPVGVWTPGSARYGLVADRYTVAEGIRDGVLCDYRVQVLGVGDHTVAELLAAEPDRRSVAVADALLNELAEGHMRRVLTFHRLRTGAHRFVRIARQVSASRGLLIPTLLAQSGFDSPKARVAALRRLEVKGGLIASPRIYLEGTDVRAVDTVAFVDPKSSPIDISQGIGRALRVNPADPGKIAQIVIPVAVLPNQSVGAALDASEFKRVWEVLRVLAAQDERLAATLEAARPAASARRLEFLPRSDAATRADETPPSTVHTSPTTTVSAGTHAAARDDATALNAAASHARDDEFLASHVALQGLVRDLAHQITLRAAEEVGDQRARDVSLVAAYASRVGTTRLPAGFSLEDGYPLAERVERLRDGYRTGRLPADLVAKLEVIPGWKEESGPRTPVAQIWPRLLSYEAQHGHAAVPSGAVAEDGFALGAAVDALRALRRAGRLDRRDQLQCEALAGWTWDPESTTPYLASVPLLREFVRVVGHARVPAPEDWPIPGPDAPGQEIVAAVARVRSAYADGTLHAGDIRALEREFNLPWTAPVLTPGLRRKLRVLFAPNRGAMDGRDVSKLDSGSTQSAMTPTAPSGSPWGNAWAIAAPAPGVSRRGRRGDDPPRGPRTRLGD
jgi:superfamily II DNA or RNA helicase